MYIHNHKVNSFCKWKIISSYANGVTNLIFWYCFVWVWSSSEKKFFFFFPYESNLCSLKKIWKIQINREEERNHSSSYLQINYYYFSLYFNLSLFHVIAILYIVLNDCLMSYWINESARVYLSLCFCTIFNYFLSFIILNIALKYNISHRLSL